MIDVFETFLSTVLGRLADMVSWDVVVITLGLGWVVNNLLKWGVKNETWVCGWLTRPVRRVIVRLVPYATSLFICLCLLGKRFASGGEAFVQATLAAFVAVAIYEIWSGVGYKLFVRLGGRMGRKLDESLAALNDHDDS